MTSDWFEDELVLLDRLEAGETICVSMRRGVHPHLISWAMSHGLFVRIDRKSKWGIRSCWGVTVIVTP